jgi:hypothetical protein
MMVQLLDHEEKQWERVAQVISDSGKTQMVYFNWHHEHGYEVENYTKLPAWLTDEFGSVSELAQFLDDHTYRNAYNKIEVNI